MATTPPHVQLFPLKVNRRSCSFYSTLDFPKSLNLKRNGAKVVVVSSLPRSKPSLENERVSSKFAEKSSVSRESIKGRKWMSSLLQGLSYNKLVGDQLVLDILYIALPALLALAADPITSLVDTAFIGHLGSAELAGVGVSISVFNLVSKLFNIPLLNITTSFVAEEEVLIRDQKNGDKTSKRSLPSVSMSLVLAAGLGVAEAVALSVPDIY